MYNIVRLAFELSGKDVGAGWIHDFKRYRKKEVVILKTHFHLISTPPDIILYSYRDIRDVIASNKRQSGRLFTLEKIDHILELYTYWMRRSNFTMRYESFIQDSAERMAKLILEFLNLFSVPVSKVMEEVEKLEVPSSKNRWNFYDKVNLLHPNHITNGGTGTWRDIDPKFIRRVEKRHRQWFIDNNYVLKE